MLKNYLLWHLLGGVGLLTFLMVFGIRPPSGAQDASRGSPGVPRAIPSTNFLWFWVDLGWILMWFGLLLGVPGSAQAIKWISKFGQHSPCVWRVQGYQNSDFARVPGLKPKGNTLAKHLTVQRKTTDPWLGTVAGRPKASGYIYIYI